jgi:hypothetical protein
MVVRRLVNAPNPNAVLCDICHMVFGTLFSNASIPFFLLL